MRAPAPEVAAARIAVFLTFALNGFGFASWAARIPDIKSSLGLTSGGLGLVLLAGSACSVVTLPLAGAVVMRLGAATTIRAAVALIGLGLPTLGVALDVISRPVAAAVAIGIIAVGISLWDVAMNHQGAEVEHGLGRTIMPIFHACFSAGTVAGALLAAGLVALGVAPLVHLALAAALVLVAGMIVPGRFLPRAGSPLTSEGVASEAGEGAVARDDFSILSAWREPRTLVIGLVVMVAALAEGTANDWIALAFTEGHQQRDWVGLLAFATFLSAMTAGRLVGGRALDRWGRVGLLRALFVLAGVGSLLTVFGSPLVALVGVALWGLGASLGFPTGMSAAADEPRRAAARLSVVSTIGYCAFLVGPPLLGFLADHVGVLNALLLVGVLVAPALVAVPALRERDEGHAARDQVPS